jgi:hypothetical protein
MTSNDKIADTVQEGTPHGVTAYDSDDSRVEVEDRSLGNYLCQDVRGSMFTEFQLVILTFCTGIQGEN